MRMSGEILAVELIYAAVVTAPQFHGSFANAYTAVVASLAWHKYLL